MSNPNVPGVEVSEIDQSITPDTSVVNLKMAAVIECSWGPTELTWVEKPIDLKTKYTVGGKPSAGERDWLCAWYMLKRGVPLYLKRVVPDDIKCANLVIVIEDTGTEEVSNLIFTDDSGASNAAYGGFYLDLYVQSDLYRFWWDVADGDTAPADGGGTLVEVDITASDDEDAVAAATAAAIDLITGLTTDYTTGATFNVTHLAADIDDAASTATPLTPSTTAQGVDPTVSAPDSAGVDWEDTTYTFAANDLFLIKLYPGIKGNDYAFKILNYDGTLNTFDLEVSIAAATGGYDVLQTVTLSRIRQFDNFGNQLYLEERIKDFGLPLSIIDNTTELDSEVPSGNLVEINAAGGVDGTAVAATDIVQGWTDIANLEEDWRVALTFGWSDATVITAVHALTSALVRKYTTAHVDGPNGDTAALVAWSDSVGISDSRYAKYCEWFKYTDEFNGGQVYLPPSVIAGTLIGQNRSANPFKPYAGLRRGTFSCEGLAQNYSPENQNTILGNKINPLGLLAGSYALIDNLTGQTYKSVLSNMNTRFLFDHIAEVGEKFLLAYSQEYNDEDTRSAVYEGLTSFIDRLVLDKSLISGIVVCDDSNNTAIIIDNEEMIVDIYLQPPRAAKKIKLRLTAIGSNVTAEEFAA